MPYNVYIKNIQYLVISVLKKCVSVKTKSNVDVV